jgi:hypothetical protein
MKKYLLTLMLASVCYAQTPSSTPIMETADTDVYDTKKITSPGIVVICDTTAYVYSINVTVNAIGTGGRIIIRNRGGNNSIFNSELTSANQSKTWAYGLAANGGIEIVNNANNCDVDVMIDYRK